MSSYNYIATVGFECSNAYKLINRAMNIDLKTNYDEYECEDYQISLDNDMVFVYFKEPNKALIRRTMDTIAYALGEDEYCWDLRNQKKDCDVPEIKVEGEDEDGEISDIPDDDCSSCCECCDISEEEALEILAEYAEEERIEAEKEKKHNDLYKEKYDKMIAAGWFTYHAEFLATCHKFLAIIEDSPRAKMKIIMVQSLYVYIEQNVKIMAFFDEPRYKEQRKQSIDRMLNQMSIKIVELKASATEHMTKGNITHITMENLFAVLNSADQKIQETLNILNGVVANEVKE
jgi:hypothetical protein